MRTSYPGRWKAKATTNGPAGSGGALALIPEMTLSIDIKSSLILVSYKVTAIPGAAVANRIYCQGYIDGTIYTELETWAYLTATTSHRQTLSVAAPIAVTPGKHLVTVQGEGLDSSNFNWLGTERFLSVVEL